MRTEPALTWAPSPRHVDPGLGLDRPLLRPAALGPVGLELVEPGHLEIDQPLGGGHVAVEPGHHHPHREAVLHRQRLAVHGDGQHRVAVVGERGQRRTAVPAVPGGLQHRVGPGLHAGLGEQLTREYAGPPGVADEIPTHLVRDAAQRDPGLGQLAVDQVLVAEGQLPLDHAVDAQLPVRGRDRRRGQGGVDEVEVAVRRTPGLDPGDAEVRTHGDLAVPHREPQQPACLLGVASAAARRTVRRRSAPRRRRPPSRTGSGSHGGAGRASVAAAPRRATAR